MPKAEFFRGLGLFVAGQFLEPDYCAEIVADARGYEWRAGRVLAPTGSLEIDEGARRAFASGLPEPHGSLVGQRLLAIKPALEAHFGTRLSSFETPNLLRYTEGCFFRAHTDNQQVPGTERQRQLCLSVLLNNQEAAPSQGAYCGGSLVFYGLLGDAKLGKFGFPLQGETGALVAFPTSVSHEVEAVTSGERYAIVTCWY